MSTRMKIALATCSILVALAGRAAAQPAMTPPAPVSEPARVPVGEPSSEDLALTLSLGGTVASWGLLFGSGYLAGRSENAAGVLGLAGGFGIVFAPSFGHWYTGEIFTRGMGLRLAGGAAVMVGFAVALSQSGLFTEDESSNTGEPMAGPLIALAGVGLFVAGTVDDIVTAPRRVRRQNRERGFALAPIAIPRATGLALSGRF
jgi:hypothetical protein